MPLNTKTLSEKINPLKTEFAGSEVNLRYRAGLITPKWEAKFKNKSDGVYQQAHELIESWDVEGDDGKPYPLTVEALKDLPVEFVAYVVSACAQDLVPNRKTSGRSGGSSFAE